MRVSRNYDVKGMLLILSFHEEKRVVRKQQSAGARTLGEVTREMSSIAGIQQRVIPYSLRYGCATDLCLLPKVSETSEQFCNSSSGVARALNQSRGHERVERQMRICLQATVHQMVKMQIFAM